MYAERVGYWSTAIRLFRPSPRGQRHDQGCSLARPSFAAERLVAPITPSGRGGQHFRKPSAASVGLDRDRA